MYMKLGNLGIGRFSIGVLVVRCYERKIEIYFKLSVNLLRILVDRRLIS